ncbi:LacI family DNA-binding transcriptional regulator [Gynuella sunshinyii]|uniref:Transcriptional regulator n=1 Tax=Gynuella sunshinyii YC6258 TaxID=1445510 RepID=A0A0C5VQ33_9GAMM|nr:LacI family DNA-binding transcriptional regulator [Gynuella sunshinyii]AJQ96356.1 transcriptional regulator [Gynuella sunshinyii YC6258]
MRKKKVTMMDIASAVGVSQPTVSAIINGSDTIRVSSETNRRVLQIAEEMGYPLRRKVHHDDRSGSLILLINSLNMHDPFISAVSAAQKRAWELNTVLTIFDYEDDMQLLAHMLQQVVRDIDCQGVIYAINSLREITAVTVAAHQKLVYLNCFDSKEIRIPTIVPADFMGGFRATEHLLNQGYRKIAMITGESWSESSNQRVRGYRQAMINADCPINERLIAAGNWSVRQSYLQVRTWLSAGEQIDAIFCASDLMAVGVYQAIQEQGRKIPEDIAVMGFDNQLLAGELLPPLSSIDLPYDEMGRMAVDYCLIGMIEGIAQTKIEGELSVRESTSHNTNAQRHNRAQKNYEQ